MAGVELRQLGKEQLTARSLSLRLAAIDGGTLEVASLTLSSVANVTRIAVHKAVLVNTTTTLEANGFRQSQGQIATGAAEFVDAKVYTAQILCTDCVRNTSTIMRAARSFQEARLAPLLLSVVPSLSQKGEQGAQGVLDNDRCDMHGPVDDGDGRNTSYCWKLHL